MSPALVAILNSSVTFLSANWSLERKTTPQWWYLIIANVGQSHSGVGTNTYGFAVGYEHPMTSEESDRCAQLPPVHRDKNVGLKGLPDLVLPIDSLLFQGYGMFLYVIQSNMFRARPNPFLLTQESIVSALSFTNKSRGSQLKPPLAHRIVSSWPRWQPSGNYPEGISTESLSPPCKPVATRPLLHSPERGNVIPICSVTSDFQ
ncbi:hypothetical protein PV325_006580 [Microctonus aethiopoides]|nr:hypothetical protein PV325_006580 [Microctonus aethiopoides]